MNSDIRWKQRFDNFDRAFALLREVCEAGVDSFSQLEKEGAIQRFEVAFELAWKTLKDFLEESGVEVIPVTPRNVIKLAFAVTSRCSSLDRYDATSKPSFAHL